MARAKKPKINSYEVGDVVKFKPVELRKPLKVDGFRNKWRIDLYEPGGPQDGPPNKYKVMNMRPSISKRNEEGVYVIVLLNQEGLETSTYFEAWDSLLDPHDLDTSTLNDYSVELDGIVIDFKAR